jgi:hypothetical protein
MKLNTLLLERVKLVENKAISSAIPTSHQSQRFSAYIDLAAGIEVMETFLRVIDVELPPFPPAKTNPFPSHTDYTDFANRVILIEINRAEERLQQLIVHFTDNESKVEVY